MSLATCESVDECADWADLAEALASYARQRNDETLLNLARRIKDRAIRRCGEVAGQLEPTPQGRPWPTDGNRVPGHPVTSPRETARIGAGLSKQQMSRAMAVGAVPAVEREAMLERPGKPATVTELAKMGKKREPKPAPALRGVEVDAWHVRS